MTIHFPRVGERFIDRYEITEILGAGGMSRVYGAVQDGLNRKVAIKLLAPVGAESMTEGALDNIAARFEREAQLISRFRSSHTVVMYDYGRSADYLYMILEHVEGMNLHQLVERSGSLPATRVARILRQALSSLAEAHEMGILHRDIKPQNIMVYEHLGDPDTTKVLDFGIAKAIGETGRDAAKLTEERTIVGTPSYMSPEQILGNKLTAASDIYSLGLVAYELLFGIVAVEADSAVSTMARHLAPTPIEIPDDRGMSVPFLDILRRMIAKDVAQRYKSAAEVLADLNAWDGGDISLTLPRIAGSNVSTLDGMQPAAQLTTEQSTRPLVVTAALLVVAILVAVGVVVALVAMMNARSPDEGAVAVTPPEVEVPLPADPVLAPDPEPPAELAAQAPPVVEAVPEEAQPVAVVAEPDPAPADPVRSKTVRKDPAPPPTKDPKPPADKVVEPPTPTVVVQPAPAPEPVVKPVVVKPAPVVAAKPTEKEIAAAKKKKADEAAKAAAAAKEAAAEAERKKKAKAAPPLSF